MLKSKANAGPLKVMINLKKKIRKQIEMLVFFVGFDKFCSNFNKDPNIQKKETNQHRQEK